MAPGRRTAEAAARPALAIEAAVADPSAATFALTAQKTVYGGKHVAVGDTIFPREPAQFQVLSPGTGEIVGLSDEAAGSSRDSSSGSSLGD